MTARSSVKKPARESARAEGTAFGGRDRAEPVVNLLAGPCRVNRRRRAQRSTTILVREPASLRRFGLGLVLAEGKRHLPLTRAECAGVPRPCPYVSCRHHLYLEALPHTGNIRLVFPDLEPDQMSPSCSLDVAELGPLSRDDISKLLNLTRQGLEAFEKRTLERYAAALEAAGLAEDVR